MYRTAAQPAEINRDEVLNMAMRIRSLDDAERDLLWQIVGDPTTYRPKVSAVWASRAKEGIATLTEREHQIMTMIVQGFRNKEVARSLNISHRTVEAHRYRVMMKVGATNVAHLCALVAATEQP